MEKEYENENNNNNDNAYEPSLEGLDEKSAEELQPIMHRFISSYSKKEETESDQQWLKNQYLQELPSLSEDEAEKMAHDTISAVEEYDKNLMAVNTAASKGISKEQWLANEIANAATGVSIIQHGEYLKSIDTALTNGNAQMLRTVTTNAGEISQCRNLDGYMAEQFHVNTFNNNAALAKSKYYAEVKVPNPGEIYGKNSVDVVILDSTNPKEIPVHRYQVKYGANAKTTIQLLRDEGAVTKYSNQQIVVPPDQVEAVQKAFPGKTVVSQIGGTEKVPVKSDQLSKEQAKNMQLEVQEGAKIPAANWNSFNTKELALHIGKNAGLVGLQAAALTAGISLAAKVANGEDIDVENAVSLALETGADAGLKAATAGALKVGVEKGIIGLIPKGTPVGIIANIACIGIENIRIMGKVATGEISMSQALELMGRTSVSMVYGLGWGTAGAGIGAVALSWIPVVGPFIGGLVGGMVGYMAGSKFGNAVFTGVKTVANGVKSVCKSAWNKVKSGARKIKSLLFG